MSKELYVTTDDGLRLFVRIKGEGSRTVIVPNAIYMEDAFDSFMHDFTFVFMDLRNRGRSEMTQERAQVERGIHHDVDDLETVRRHLALEQFDVIGWSYLGLVVALYAMRYPQHIGRVVQISPMQPHMSTQYPAHLMNDDATRREVLAYFAEVQRNPPSGDPIEHCRKVWSVLQRLYVTDEVNLKKISNWGFCEHETERNQGRHLMGNIMPTIAALNLQPEDFAKVTMPVLVIHGTKDRSAPCGGGMDWVRVLPDARFVSVENAGHAPWVESPDLTYGAIRTFLGGRWPEQAVDQSQLLHRNN